MFHGPHSTATAARAASRPGGSRSRISPRPLRCATPATNATDVGCRHAADGMRAPRAAGCCTLGGRQPMRQRARNSRNRRPRRPAPSPRPAWRCGPGHSRPLRVGQQGSPVPGTHPACRGANRCASAPARRARRRSAPCSGTCERPIAFACPNRTRHDAAAEPRITARISSPGWSSHGRVTLHAPASWRTTASGDGNSGRVSKRHLLPAVCGEARQPIGRCRATARRWSSCRAGW